MAAEVKPTNGIDQRAVLVYQAISVWTARRFDRKASEEVAANHKATAERAGRFNKCLIDVKNKLYTNVKQIEGEARRWHEEHTLPWSQDGARIMSAEMFLDYSAKMNGFREQFDHAVTEFVRAYPKLKADAEKELNGLYNEEDYPSDDEVREKFAFRISVHPVPVANDFRVAGIDEDTMARMRTELEEEVQQAVRQAERDRWARLIEPVQHALGKLSSPDAIFRDSLIGNIQEAVATLPKLGLAKDEEFDLMVAEVKAKLAVCDPQRLREDPNARADAARKAAEIMRKMSAFMGPQQ